MKIADCKVGLVVRSTVNVGYKGTYTIVKVNTCTVSVQTNEDQHLYPQINPACLEEVK